MAYTTINKSSSFQNQVLYTGNGSNGHAITGVGFQPDMVWLKNRSAGTSHVLVDAVRGNNKVLSPNNNVAEGTTNANKDFRSFDSDGFTVDTNENYGSTNSNGANIVAWNWKAGGAGSANSDGDIASTVSANTTAGFSIVKWTSNGSDNNTIGHGLGVAPKIVLYKRTDGTGPWYWVYKYVDGTLDYLILDDTNAKADLTLGTYGFTTSSTITNLGFGNTHELIAYCFAEKTGYSKFGKYTATGSTSETPFIYTGFKPQFVMTKNITGADSWTMSDIPRDDAVGGGNGTGARLRADNAAAEDTNTSWGSIQKYSNGFSPQGNDHVTNGSGQSYIYMAFGQSLVGSNNVPCTSR